MHMFSRRRHAAAPASIPATQPVWSAMKISEVQNLLAKAAQIAGDAPVILKSIEGEVETAIKAVELTLTAAGDADGTTITLTHGAPETVETDPASEPADVAAG